MGINQTSQTIIAERGAQMFPTLTELELARLKRFGAPMRFAAGETIQRTGETGHGLLLILAGEAEVTQVSHGHAPLHITTHKAGSFMGELAQLSGRPVLVDAVALTEVEAVAIAPDRLRALIIAEAVLGERIMRALILRRVGLIESGGGGPVIVGHAGDGNVLRLVNFLRRNGHPYTQLDPAGDSCAQTLVGQFEVTADELPIVLCPSGKLLRNPDENALARCLGLVGTLDEEALYDVVVVGAGPAGLATSVYAGSEGLKVLTLDCRSFGGQAGASSRIENYLGFPTGISGMALMGRAFNQAQKFGVEMAIPDEAVTLECGMDPLHLKLATGERVRTRSVVIATGATYRRLDVDDLDRFEGSSIHYWASPMEGNLCVNEEVALVGGGNSAGQAVVFLAAHAKKVWLLVRKPLEATMSHYLIERIEQLPNVEVVTGVQVAGLEGEGGQLDAVRWRNLVSGEERRQPMRHLFSFIGAEPNTDWLASAGIRRDARGFLLTGAEAGAQVGEDRLALETSRRGVFAVGDVRAASVKRVAASVGDGAQVVALLHAWLQDHPGEQLEVRTVQTA